MQEFILSIVQAIIEKSRIITDLFKNTTSICRKKQVEFALQRHVGIKKTDFLFYFLSEARSLWVMQ